MMSSKAMKLIEIVSMINLSETRSAAALSCQTRVIIFCQIFLTVVTQLFNHWIMQWYNKK